MSVYQKYIGLVLGILKGKLTHLRLAKVSKILDVFQGFERTIIKCVVKH